MKELIRFSLLRKLTNKMTIAFNVLLFVVLGLLMHVDYFVDPLTETIHAVVIDHSVTERLPQLSEREHEDYVYRTQSIDQEKEAYLYYDEGWFLKAEREIPQKLLYDVENDIKTAYCEEYYRKADIKTRYYIDQFNSVIVQTVKVEIESEENPCWIVLSVIFFLVLGYGNMVGNELIYEKASGTLKLTLINVSPKGHFLARILTGYLTVMIQMLVGAAEGLIWIAVRYLNDGFAGLQQWLEGYVITDFPVATMTMTPHRILVCVFVALTGLLTIQVFMLVVSSRFSNSEDASGFQGPLYLIMILVYYGFLVWGSTSFFTSTVSAVLSYVPVTSMIFAPCRILLMDMNETQGVIAAVTGLCSLIVAIYALMPIYKKNILNN